MSEDAVREETRVASELISRFMHAPKPEVRGLVLALVTIAHRHGMSKDRFLEILEANWERVENAHQIALRNIGDSRGGQRKQ